jgi:PAS domain S-box-containing protein
MEHKPTYEQLQKQVDNLTEKINQLQKSEYLYQRMLENLPVSVFAKDVRNDYKYILWNRELEKVVGNTSEEAIGKSDFDIFENKKEAEYLRNYDIEIMQGKNIIDIPNEEITTNKGKRIIHTRKVPLYDENGKPEILLGFLEDVTEQRQTEEALNFANFALEHLSEGVFWVMEDAHLFYMNKSAYETLGYTKEELMAKTILDIDPNFNNEKKWAEHRLELRQKGSKTIETIHIAKDGKIIPVEVLISFIEFGGKTYSCSLTRNISERKKIEEALKLMTEELDRFFKVSIDLLCIANTDGQFLQLSNSWEKILGYNINSLEGKKFIDFVHPHDVNNTLKVMSGLSSTQDVTGFINRYRCADGSYRWLEWNSTSPDGKTMYASARDITEKFEANAAMEKESAFLRKVIDTVPGFIFVKDQNSSFVLANKAIALAYGTIPEKMIGKNDSDFVSNITEVQKFINDDQEVIKSKISKFVAEEKITYIDGSEHYLSTIKVPLIEENGTCNAVLGVTTDITERKLAEQKIRTSEEMLRQITDNMVDMLGKFDENGNYVYISPSYEKILGYKPEDLIGKFGPVHVPPEDLDEVTANIFNILVRGSGSIQFRFANKMGNYRWIESTGKLLIDTDGKITGSILGSRDITDRKMAEQALLNSEMQLRNQNEEYLALNEEYAAMNEELADSFKMINDINQELIAAKDKAEESDMLKSAFLANMSHEIRTPMNAIVGFADLLNDKELSREKTEKYIKIINSNSLQLLAIINDIIDISKIEAGQVSLAVATVDLNQVLHDLHSIFKASAAQKNIDLIIDCDAYTEKYFVETDDTRLKQILTNLLSNALKFTQSGKIEFGYSFSDQNILFYVKDTGIGIAEEHKSIVFERFRQVESSMSRKFGGTGLGLSISKALVELMGGSIWFESIPNMGTTFFFAIPYKPSEVLLIPNENLQEQRKSVNWSDKTILVTEDEETNYYYLEELLAPTKAKIIHAKDGKQAVELFLKNPTIDLVIMDIKMPVMDGFEATKIIKSNKSSIHIIAQTAYAMANDRTKAIKAGFDSYISKPIDKEILFGIINDAFRKKNK